MAGARLIIPIAEPVLNNEGLVAAGSTLTIYDTGTTNLSAVFADAALTTPITNPLTANAAGRFYDQATVWWVSDAIAYDYKLDVSDGTIITGDQIYTEGAPIDLSLYALINSPTFTGVPQAPTPATSDNSNKIATTAYVKANVPLASQSVAGLIEIATTSEALAGTNTTNAIVPSTLAEALANGDITAQFPQSDALPGYVILPGGIQMEWGTTATINNGAAGTTTFTKAFTTAVYGVWISRSVNGTSDGTDGVPFGSITLTTFVIDNGTNMPTAYRYFAVGK